MDYNCTPYSQDRKLEGWKQGRVEVSNFLTQKCWKDGNFDFETFFTSLWQNHKKFIKTSLFLVMLSMKIGCVCYFLSEAQNERKFACKTHQLVFPSFTHQFMKKLDGWWEKLHVCTSMAEIWVKRLICLHNSQTHQLTLIETNSCIGRNGITSMNPVLGHNSKMRVGEISEYKTGIE